MAPDDDGNGSVLNGTDVSADGGCDETPHDGGGESALDVDEGMAPVSSGRSALDGDGEGALDGSDGTSHGVNGSAVKPITTQIALHFLSPIQGVRALLACSHFEEMFPET